jgi:hypothetical protein
MSSLTTSPSEGKMLGFSCARIFLLSDIYLLFFAVAIDVVFDNKSIRREDARIFAPIIMFADFAFSSENYLLFFADFFAVAIDVIKDDIRREDAPISRQKIFSRISLFSRKISFYFSPLRALMSKVQCFFW